MWYGHFSPSENLVNRLFPPPYRQGWECLRRLEYYRGWRQCQYLALSTASGYTSGLTVYLDHTLEYLIGITAHGHSNLQLGRPKGVQIHLSLNKGEHLTSAWLHVRGYNYGRLDCLSVSGFFTPPPSLKPKHLLSDWMDSNFSLRRIMDEYVILATTRTFDSIVANLDLEATILPAVGYA